MSFEPVTLCVETPESSRPQAAAACEPERFTVTRYRCPHCRRSRSSRRSTAEHMTRCWHNPDNHACKTCAHYEPASSGCGDGPYCNCSSPEFCHVGVIIPADRLMIRCELWEASEE